MGKKLQYFFTSLGSMLDFSGGGTSQNRLLLARRMDENARQTTLGKVAGDFAYIGKDIATASAKYANGQKSA